MKMCQTTERREQKLNNLNNPFFDLLSIMQKQGEKNNPVPFFLGKVVCKDKMTINVAGITLQKNEYLINDYVDKTKEENLNNGDRVLMLLSADQQQFILVCKLV